MNTKPNPRTLLVIDDDQVMCDIVKDYFTSESVEVLAACTGKDGLAICAQRKVDVVLLDQKLPDAEGHTLCPAILTKNDRTKVIFITAYPSFANAFKAVKLGAYDYVGKPFDLEELALAINKAFRAIDLERIEHFQQYRTEKDSEKTVIVGDSGMLSKVLQVVDVAASSDVPVLITGETGTGKDLVAKTIHYKSAASRAPFIEINCATLPESIIEAELFGYEKGAFTGAVTSHRGIFEMAEGGTLLLNEIGEMPLNLQSKLLSVLEGKQIKRLGGDLITPVNFRILAATNVDLQRALGKSLREDLYYRLSVIHIHLPPLRERRGDIPSLCDYLLKKIARASDAAIPESEMSRLTAYEWPGNVRELKNILERAFILRKGPLLHPSEFLATGNNPIDCPPWTCAAENDIKTLEEIERDHIRNSLEGLSHNYAQTARTLGISLSTLKRKLKTYRLK